LEFWYLNTIKFVTFGKCTTRRYCIQKSAPPPKGAAAADGEKLKRIARIGKSAAYGIIKFFTK
jgi:hypothetical protein